MSVAGHAVNGRQRFTSSSPCPVCRGHDDARRGAGERCFGFLSDDGKWAHCTREEHGDGCRFNSESQTYAHRIGGPCRCGTEHAPAEPGARKGGKRKGEFEAAYDYFYAAGQPARHRTIKYRNPKRFTQCRPNGPKGWIFNLDGVETILYRRPELIAAHPDKWVLFVEGEKDVDRLMSMGLVATCNPMGAGKWRDRYAADLAGRRVAIIPDNDAVGRDHANDVARGLVGKAREVKIIDLAVDMPELAEGGDVSDWLNRRRSIGDLLRLADEAPAFISKVDQAPPHETNGKHQADGPDRWAVIECHDRGLKTVTDETLDALKRHNDPPEQFNFGGVLAWIKEREDSGQAFVEEMSGDALRNRLADVASFTETREAKNGEVTTIVFPPRDVVRAIMARKTWSKGVAPLLEGVVESPRFLPDGRLILTPGYCPAGRIYYKPPGELLSLDVPGTPSDGDVEAAKRLIFDEYLVDFFFDGDASKANALASMLLPFLRLVIDAPTPLHMFEAATEGTGKGKLANACAYPSRGRQLHSTTQKEDEAEWRKTITTNLLKGDSHFFIDNMYNPRTWDGTPLPIDSANLACALTQEEWSDRLMGSMRPFRGKVRCVWMGSGNNIEWSKELARRVVPIRLKTKDEDPSERTGFHCEKDGSKTLEEWAAKRRVALLRACLILCRNWFAKGRLDGRHSMGSYELYAKVMGGVLVAAGVDGFLGNLAKGKGKDRESIRWVALVQAWHASRERMATSAAQLYDLIFGEPGADGRRIGGNPDLQLAFADILGDGKELSQKQKLGNALRKQEERVWNGQRIVRCGSKTATGTVLYRLADPNDEEKGDEIA